MSPEPSVRPCVGVQFLPLTSGFIWFAQSAVGECLKDGEDEAPRSSLLHRSSRFGYEGWKLWGILRDSMVRGSNLFLITAKFNAPVNAFSYFSFHNLICRLIQKLYNVCIELDQNRRDSCI